MNKKMTLPITLMLVLCIALSACSSLADVPRARESSVLLSALRAAGLATTTPTPDALASLSAMQLALGTLKLVGTSNVVTASQAAVLLPLWQALKTAQAAAAPAAQDKATPAATPDPLATPVDNSSARAALDAQVELVRTAMTNAQLQAIVEMKLDQAGMSATLTSLGITIQAPDGAGQNRANSAAAGTALTPMAPLAGASRPAGGPGSGAAPRQGAGPGAGNSAAAGASSQPANNQQPPTRAGAQPDGQNLHGGGFIPGEVIDAVIAYLQSLTA